jgi:biopolymer transport protein ExbD
MTRRPSQEDVTLNVTAMLDMAFQLLAFFVLTFKPPPGEDQIYLKLPPVKPVAGFSGKENAGQDETKNIKDVKSTHTVVVTLLDENGSGVIKNVQISDPSVPSSLKTLHWDPDMSALRTELHGYFKPKDAGDSGDQKGAALGNYEQLLVQATPTAHWQDVLKVADVCTEYTTTKEDKIPITFGSVPEDPGE